jgi:hypothetical protein
METMALFEFSPTKMPVSLIWSKWSRYVRAYYYDGGSELRGYHPCYRAAFLLAAQRAFISCDSLLRPAGVSPLLFRDDLDTVAEWLPLLLAHLAFAAADNLARAAGDTFLLPLRVVKPGAVAPISDAKRLSKISICRRMPTACSSFCRDIIMIPLISVLGRVRQHNSCLDYYDRHGSSHRRSLARIWILS